MVNLRLTRYEATALRVVLSRGNTAGPRGVDDNGAKGRGPMDKTHDRLIAFLEREADFLRERLGELGLNTGVTTDGGESSPKGQEYRATKQKLDEIEGHIADLRR